MSTDDRGFDLDDEDRLPWLEAADDYDDESSVSTIRLVLLVLGGLLLIGAIVGGLWLFQNRGDASRGELIAAPADPYKEQPKDADAKVFQGEGDSSFAASEGAEPVGKVDANRVPEEPAVTPEQRAAANMAAEKTAIEKAATTKTTVAAATTPTKAATKPGSTVSAPVRATTAAPVTKAATTTAPASGGSTIQLGAFSSQDSAMQAWASLSKRFSVLSGLSRSIAPVAVEGGNVYRLRAATGSAAQAADVCRKLKIAGETCIVVR